MKLLGISGSLRKASFNTKLLGAASRVAESSGVEVTCFDIGTLPHYNGDLDGDEKPAPVSALKDAIRQADGLLIVSPEYNYGIPGVIKNAIDWASRPAYKSVLAHKPAALLSASMSNIGGARMQAQMKNVLAGTLTPVYPAPEFLVATAQEAFDDDGGLVDEKTRQRLENFVTGFIDWAGRFAND